MKKLFTLLLVLIACSVSAIDMGPYDPGAARKTDLGTMAAEAATDYVATDTFTGHTGATGSAVHGLGTISTRADTDYVATSALALRLDTVNASFTGDIDVTGDVGAATVNGVAPLTAAEKTYATRSHFQEVLCFARTGSLGASETVALNQIHIRSYSATATIQIATTGATTIGGYYFVKVTPYVRSSATGGWSTTGTAITKSVTVANPMHSPQQLSFTFAELGLNTDGTMYRIDIEHSRDSANTLNTSTIVGLLEE